MIPWAPLNADTAQTKWEVSIVSSKKMNQEPKSMNFADRTQLTINGWALSHFIWGDILNITTYAELSTLVLTIHEHTQSISHMAFVKAKLNLDKLLWQLWVLSHSHVQYLYWARTWLEIRQRRREEWKQRRKKTQWKERNRERTKVTEIDLVQVTVSRHKHQFLLSSLTEHIHFLSSPSPHPTLFHPHFTVHLRNSAANISAVIILLSLQSCPPHPDLCVQRNSKLSSFLMCTKHTVYDWKNTMYCQACFLFFFLI